MPAVLLKLWRPVLSVLKQLSAPRAVAKSISQSSGHSQGQGVWQGRGEGVVLAGECCTTCSSGLNLNAIVTCAGAKSFGNSFAAPLVLSDCGLAGETCRIGQTFVPASKPVGAPPSTPNTLLLSSSSCLASFNRDPIQKLLRANVNSFKLQQLTLLLLTNWHALPQKGEGKRMGGGREVSLLSQL